MLSQSRKTLVQCISLASLIFSSSLVMAKPPQGEDGERRRMPPPEAVEACASSGEGDVCSFEGRRGEVEGVCFLPSEDSDLACAPEGGPAQEREER